MTSTGNPIAGFEDWPDTVRRLGSHQGHSPASARLAQLLGVPSPLPTPAPSLRRTRVVHGVQLQELEWQLPYGPPTLAYLLRPDGATGDLPGVLWLHCHGGDKWLGAERLIDAGDDTGAEVTELQRALYSGRAVANDLARAGFAVLVHDSFSWGSRGFVLDPPPVRIAEGLQARRALWRQQGVHATPAMEYNAAAALHEHTIAKTAGLLGTSYAGMVALEDLAALEMLRAMPGVDPARVGVGGFSGGGGRALVLSALAPEVRAAVVSCMMTTFAGLFPTHMDAHSWLLSTPGLAAGLDWPDLAAINRRCRYLMQFASEDPLFTAVGMHDADARLTALLDEGTGRYTGSWHETGHAMTPAMLRESAAHLVASLS